MQGSAKAIRIGLVFLLILFLQACATAGPITVARDQFRHGDADAALQTLAEANVGKRDELLLYLDRGMIAQAAGRYRESVDSLLRAAEIVDKQDFISISEQTAAVIVNDWVRTYSGEYSERLWIHTFQMINFLMLGDPEAAAVEARRAVAVMDRFENVLSTDVFTRVLTAMSFEAAGQFDSASVEYRKLKDELGEFNLKPLVENRDNNGELAIIVAGGLVPKKASGNLYLGDGINISFPFYPEIPRSYSHLDVNVTAASSNELKSDTLTRDVKKAYKNLADTQDISVSLGDISRRALDARGKSIGTRQALRVAAKKSISKAIFDENEALGIAAQVFFFLTEQADTRGWDTLPAAIKLIRIPLPPGEHDLGIDIESSGLYRSGVERFELDAVGIQPGQRTFRLIRLGYTNPKIDTIQN